MIGAILGAAAGLGGLLASGAGAAVSLGGSILGGVGSAAGGLVSAGGSIIGGAGKTVGGLFGGGGTFTNPMAVMGAPATDAVAASAGGMGPGLFDVLTSESVARLAGTAGSVYSMFNKPDTPDVVPQTTGGALPSYRSPITSTLPNMAGFTPQPAAGQRVFQTAPAAVTAGPDVTIYILIAIAIAVLFLSKK